MASSSTSGSVFADGDHHHHDPAQHAADSLLRRSLHAVGDILSPFSAAAVATLPKIARPRRYTRADAIPHAPSDVNGQMPTVRDYHAINSLPPKVRIPKKIPTPIKVEAKVWFANERTWVAWLNISVLLGTLALALFNTSKDEIATRFAYAYALISVGVLIYAFAIYQYRISMIRRRDPGHFDSIAGPIVLGVVLFTAVLLNFIIRGKGRKSPYPALGSSPFFNQNPQTQPYPSIPKDNRG